MNKKRMRRWTLWLAVITIAEISVFHHYNQQLNPSSQVSPVRKYIHSDFHKIANVTSQQLQSHLYALSPDHSDFAYITPANKFFVIDVKTGKVLVQQTLSYTPDYIKWIGNSQLFIGTESRDASGLKNIRLNTFDVNSNSFRLIHVFTQYKNTASLEKIAFSPYTNDVYVLLGNKNNSIEYHFNTNNTMFPYHLSGRLVRSLMVTQTSDQLYYQDYANGQSNVWVYDYRTTSSHLIAANAKLVGINSNTLIYAKINVNGDATALEMVSDWQKGSKTLLQLSSPIPFSQLFMYHNQVYQMKSTSMKDLQTGKTITLPENQQTVVWEGNLYIVESSGKVLYFDPSQSSSGGSAPSAGAGASQSGSSQGSSTGTATGSVGSSGTSGASTGTRSSSGSSSGSSAPSAGTGSSGSPSASGSASNGQGGSSGSSGGSSGPITGNSIITPST